jgi:hypothetical protein
MWMFALSIGDGGGDDAGETAKSLAEYSGSHLNHIHHHE